jgi:hypothetical protein
MHRVLILGEEEKEKIRALIGLAEQEPHPLTELKRLAEGFDPTDPSSRRDRHINEKFTIDLPIGIRVTYTHEFQPIGLCRHMSISVHPPKEDRYPDIPMVTILMEAFGFMPLNEDRTSIWLEKYQAGFGAVNVLEPIE